MEEPEEYRVVPGILDPITPKEFASRCRPDLLRHDAIDLVRHDPDLTVLFDGQLWISRSAALRKDPPKR